MQRFRLVPSTSHLPSLARIALTGGRFQEVLPWVLLDPLGGSTYTLRSTRVLTKILRNMLACSRQHDESAHAQVT